MAAAVNWYRVILGILQLHHKGEGILSWCLIPPAFLDLHLLRCISPRGWPELFLFLCFLWNEEAKRSPSSPWLQTVSLTCDPISLYPEWDLLLPGWYPEPTSAESSVLPIILHLRPIGSSQMYLCCFWTSWSFLVSLPYILSMILIILCTGDEGSHLARHPDRTSTVFNAWVSVIIIIVNCTSSTKNDISMVPCYYDLFLNVMFLAVWYSIKWRRSSSLRRYFAVRKALATKYLNSQLEESFKAY